MGSVSGFGRPGATDMRTAIESIGKQASLMGRDAAEVCGPPDDTQNASVSQERTLAVLRTYQRGIGNDRFVLVKEAAAPISVNGRYRGEPRLAFRFWTGRPVPV